MGHRGSQSGQDAIFPPAEHTVVWPGHPHVRNERRPAVQHGSVGRGHVRVRAEDNAHPPVEIPSHRHLLAGGVGVEIDDADFDF